MFTVCPKCALTLVVTTEDLRVAQGYVRCGRCSSVFNALARLAENRGPSEERAAPPPAAPAAPAASPPGAHTPPQTPPPANARPPSVTDEDAIPDEAREFNTDKTDVSSVFVVESPPGVTDEDVIPEDALEFDPSKTDVSSVFVEPAPNPQWTAATGTFKAMIAANQEAAQAPPPASPAPAQAPAANSPRPSVTVEDVIPEEALEFDPSKTDVSSVFVEPPPNPQWTAATGTFKAMIAANQEAAQAPPP